MTLQLVENPSLEPVDTCSELVEIDLSSSSEIMTLDDDIFISIASECYFKKGLACFKMCYLVLKTFSNELNIILPDLNLCIEENDQEGIKSCVKKLFEIKNDLIQKIITIEFMNQDILDKVKLYFDNINIDDLNPLIHNTKFCEEVNTQFIFSGIHKDWLLRMNKLYLKDQEFTLLTETEKKKKKKKSVFGITYSKPKAITNVEMKTEQPNKTLALKDTSIKMDERSYLLDDYEEYEDDNSAMKAYATLGLCAAATVGATMAML